MDNGERKRIEGKGSGPVAGFVDALSKYLGIPLSVNDYSEHSLQVGSDASAICYMEVQAGGKVIHGVGVNTNIVAASLEALVSAANTALAG
jgi:2-isopropylmalate synthase